MTRQKRIFTITLTTLAVLVGAEALLNLLSGPSAVVVVDNMTGDPMDDVVFQWGKTRIVAPRVGAGESARVSLHGSGSATLFLSYKQAGHTNDRFQIPSVDAGKMRREETELILRVQSDGIGQFTRIGEPRTLLRRLMKNLWRSLEDQLEQSWGYRKLRTM